MFLKFIAASQRSGLASETKDRGLDPRRAAQKKLMT
jgi:hypothetical protein